MYRKILSLALSLALCAGILATGVFAAGPQRHRPEPPEQEDVSETVSEEQDAAVEEAASVEETVYAFLTEEMGLNRAAAWGVMANISKESDFQTDIWGDGGTSYGLCQWHNDRCSNLMAFCQENGYATDSVLGQMRYLAMELESSYPGVLQQLRETPDTPEGAYDAAWYWCYYFEIPANRDSVAQERGNLAMSWYEEDETV